MPFPRCTTGRGRATRIPSRSCGTCARSAWPRRVRSSGWACSSPPRGAGHGRRRVRAADSCWSRTRPTPRSDRSSSSTTHGHGLALLKTLDYVDATSDVHTGQLAVFIGDWFAITVRYGQIGDLRGIRASPRDQQRAALLRTGRRPVRGARPRRRRLPVRVRRGRRRHREPRVARCSPIDRAAATTNSIYRLKRENVEIRRAVAPLVDLGARRGRRSARVGPARPVALLPRHRRPHPPGQRRRRLHDNLLMTMLMASTSLQDLQQNKDMRKISAWVAIAAVPTAIAAIYGMNFDTCPSCDQPWGYPAVLGVMAGHLHPAVPGLQAVRLALRPAPRRSGREHARRQQHHEQAAEHEPVDDERQVRLRAEPAHQPGDDREADAEGDQRGEDGRTPGDVRVLADLAWPRTGRRRGPPAPRAGTRTARRRLACSPSPARRRWTRPSARRRG